MHSKNISALVRLVISRPSILFHLKQIGTLDEVITKLGLPVEEEDVNFLRSFSVVDGTETYLGVYRDMNVQVDAITGAYTLTSQEDILRKMA